ncbi:hypothetical protein ACLBWS_09815 [Brucellaceae bacterium D45D]
MITILLSPAIITPGRLQVAVGLFTNPYIRPRGRNNKRLNARLVFVGNFSAIRRAIAKALSTTKASYTRIIVTAMDKSFQPGTIVMKRNSGLFQQRAS